MSYKGEISDKSVEAPVTIPRSCTSLIELSTEMRGLLQKRQKDQVSSLLPDLEKACSRANHDMIFVYSFQGAPAGIIQAYSDAVNAGQSTIAQARGLVSGLGSGPHIS